MVSVRTTGGIGDFHSPVLVSVHECREDIVGICASTDEEQDNQEERLEVEECRLFGPGQSCSSIHQRVDSTIFAVGFFFKSKLCS